MPVRSKTELKLCRSLPVAVVQIWQETWQKSVMHVHSLLFKVFVAVTVVFS